MIRIPNRTKMLSNNLDEAHASELAVIFVRDATKFEVATEDEFPTPHTHE
jgi:hypothetical protein